MAFAQLPGRDLQTEIERRSKQNGADTGTEPTTANQNKPNHYQPNCTRPENREAALYCEVRRLADKAEKSVAIAEETNWSGWAQAGAALLAILVATWAANEARKAANASDATAKAARDGMKQSARFARQQSRDMKQSVAAAVASNALSIKALASDLRPWVSCEAQPSADLIIGETGVTCETKITLVNVGRTPALRVNVARRMICNNGSTNVLFDELRAFCQGRRVLDVVLDGETMFPQEPAAHKRSLEAATYELANIRPEDDGRRPIYFWVFVCVTYRSPVSDDIHQTAYAYGLGDLAGRSDGRELPGPVYGDVWRTARETLRMDRAPGSIAT